MKVDLRTFTPPKGTTRIVELTLTDRKNIAKRALAEYTAKQFDIGTTVVIKYHRAYYVMSRPDACTFTLFRQGYGLIGSASRVSAIAEMLIRFDPISLLRVIKLIEKNARDEASVKRQKDLDSRARIMTGTFSLADL